MLKAVEAAKIVLLSTFVFFNLCPPPQDRSFYLHMKINTLTLRNGNCLMWKRLRELYPAMTLADARGPLTNVPLSRTLLA